MRMILNFLRRWAIFNKRLLKKPGFVAILLLIPLLAAALAFIGSKDDGGIITVAVGCEDPEDPIAAEITTDLYSESSMIRFVQCTTPAEAAELVSGGLADAAWIFPSQMQKKLDRFSRYPSERNAFVSVIQRENNVLLQLSHEKLAAVLFPYLSRSVYRGFVRDNLVVLEDLTDEQLLEYYDAIDAEGEDMFHFVHKDSSATVTDTEAGGYLLAPLRGLFAILILLGGLAVSLFYMQDLSDGKFDRLTPRGQFFLSYGYHLTAVIDLSLVTLLALILSNINVSIGREVVCMILYAIIVVEFCTTLCLLCRDIRILGSLIPILAVASIVLCPVFFRMVSIPAVQYLLPPFHYLNAVYNQTYLLYMVIYAIVAFGVNWGLFLLRKKA